MSDLNKLKELKALAGKATPGPWAAATDWERAAVYSTSKDAYPKGKRVVCSGNQNNNGRYNAESWSGSDWTDAAFIAAANPATVIGLIDQLEAAQQRIAELDVKLTGLTGDYKYLINQHIPRTDEGCDEGWSRVIEANELQAKLEAAEAELARRDAAAGEPDYYILRVEVCDSYGPDVELRAFNNALDASKCKDDHGGEIVELFATQPAPSVPDGWINCSDRMPEVLDWVIAYDEVGTTKAYLSRDDKLWVRDNGDELYRVTHWMPLPAAPE